MNHHHSRQSIPTREDISIYNTLDEREAVKHFLNRTVEEIEELFMRGEGDASFYGEDMTYMGPKAFQYYFPAYLHYLESSVAEDDFETAQSVIGTIYAKLVLGDEKESIIPVKDKVIQCLQYLVDHPEKFHLEGEFADVLERGKTMLEKVKNL